MKGDESDECDQNVSRKASVVGTKKAAKKGKNKAAEKEGNEEDEGVVKLRP